MIMLNAILDILQNELEVDVTDVTEDTNLVDIDVDSIIFMTLIVYLEEKFDIEFSFDGIFMQEYSQITFKSLIKEINQLIAQKQEL